MLVCQNSRLAFNMPLPGVGTFTVVVRVPDTMLEVLIFMHFSVVLLYYSLCIGQKEQNIEH